MENPKRLSFSDLISMTRAQRLALAEKILEEERGAEEPRHLEREWGRFEDVPPMSPSDVEAEARRILAEMTIEQKIRQMTPNTTIEEYVPACIKYNDRPYYAGEDLELEIPGMKFTDGPTGVVMGRSSTCFPVSIARGATWDVGLETEIGEAMGVECRAQGANLFGGVCINLLRHSSWGRSQETYGEDPCHVGTMGAASVTGVQRNAMACVKHFALNSVENSRYKIDVQIDERALREVYLPHFKRCVEAGAAAVMSAYNKVRGHHCGESAFLLGDVLRGDWKFEGIVISDFVFGIRDGRKAAAAGVDVEMPVPGHYGEKLLAAFRRGEVEEELIDRAVLAILRTKMRFAQQTRSRARPPRSVVAGPRHVELARQAARESAVLLKNEGGLLPFDLSSQSRIAVVGRLADTPNVGDMKGSSHVYPPYVVTPLDGIKRRLGGRVPVAYADGSNEGALRAAVEGADAVVVVVGLTSDDEGEYIPHWDSGCGGDRVELGLREHDVRIIGDVAALNRRCVVVLQGGGAVLTSPWEEAVPAILMTWYPGMEGGNALAEILYGDCCPSGKLPVTFPRSPDQLPFFDKDADSITYDAYHGYFLADRERYRVAYPFGFGLSYTRFSYDELRVSPTTVGVDDEMTVSVAVTNIGSRAGDEIVQIYVACVGSHVERHVKDLKGFGRMHLEPGERRVFNHTLRTRDLAFYDVGNRCWTVEKIDYLIEVGPSSRAEDLLTALIRVR